MLQAMPDHSLQGPPTCSIHPGWTFTSIPMTHLKWYEIKDRGNWVSGVPTVHSQSHKGLTQASWPLALPLRPWGSVLPSALYCVVKDCGVKMFRKHFDPKSASLFSGWISPVLPLIFFSFSRNFEEKKMPRSKKRNSYSEINWFQIHDFPVWGSSFEGRCNSNGSITFV